MKKNRDVFLLIRAACKNRKLLSDRELLVRVLEKIPKIIGMNVLKKPIVSKAKNNPGLEGYIPIDTSNITISTYTKDLKIIACIHSCREFNHKEVLNYLKEKYSCHEIKFLVCKETDLKN